MEKMHGLFVAEWIIYKTPDNKYYDVTLTPEVLNRYLKIVENLTIIIRVNNVDQNFNKEKYSEIDQEKIKIVEIPNLLNPRSLFQNFSQAIEIINNTLKFIDVAFIRLPSIVGNMTIKRLKRKNIPFLIEMGGCAWDSYWYHSIMGKFMAPIFYFSTRSSIRNASHVVYVTKEFLQKRYPTKGTSINCSNVIINTQTDLATFSKLKIMDNKKIVIGTAAAIDVKYKGQEYVIEALRELRNKGYLIEYQLMGRGDNKRLLEIAKKNNVEQQVKFLGVHKHNDVLNWMKSLDIYVQPSKQEGLPRSVIEAMSMGIPVIGSKIAGIPELIDSNYMFNKGSVKEIISILETLINDEKLRGEVINRNKMVSNEYEYLILERRRDDFFRKFIESDSLLTIGEGKTNEN